uniref:Uncharacterized protein n=1 Tax=Tanacetum cinerariifolium TaxID=118510 RepID=A0A6L2NR34_TANCI|nr:hypothetical protein [Tanacetum cinerariifolium]
MGTVEEVEELFEDEESEMETEEEVEEVFYDETEEEEDDDTKYHNSPLPLAFKELVYHEWLLKNPQPSWPFIEETGLFYNKEEGTITFNIDDVKITFKMPHTMEIFKQT